MIPVTEAERREMFLRAIGNGHPLMDLILRCINNDPKCRAHASEVVDQMAAMMKQFPSLLEMLRHAEADNKEKADLREAIERKDREIEQKDEQVRDMREHIQLSEQHQAEEIDQLKLIYSTEMEQLKVQVKHERNTNMQLASDKDAATDRVSELDSRLQTQAKALEEKETDYLAVNHLLEKTVDYLISNKVRS